jgi:serine/alanine adding enzyme
LYSNRQSQSEHHFLSFRLPFDSESVLTVGIIRPRDHEVNGVRFIQKPERPITIASASRSYFAHLQATYASFLMKAAVIQSDVRTWNAFVASVPNATAYHQFEWKSVLEKSFGHKCYYLAAMDESGRYRGILPLVHMRSRLFGNFLVSLPFLNYGGLLAQCSKATAVLLAEAERLRRSTGATHVELRHIVSSLDGLPTKQHKVTMILQLESDASGQWQKFNAKLRNQIRKEQKSHLTCQIVRLELLDAFYDVFARNMRDLGTPVYAKIFFRNILEAFPDTTNVLAVFHNDRVIAAGIAYWFRTVLEVPWASSVGDYKHLCPNNMLYWEAIRFALDRSLTKLDFGRSTPNEGTYRFKQQWGAVPVQLNWQYLKDEIEDLPDLSPTNSKYRAAIRVWQRLPISVTRILGPRIVRSIP